MTLMQMLRRLWHHLGARRRAQFCMLFGLMVGSAFAEVISLGAVLPFISALAAPDAVLGHPAVAMLARQLGIGRPAEMLFPLTLAFIAAALLAGLMRVALVRGVASAGLAAGADISLDLYRRTLYQPYEVHVARNSSEVISGITNKVDAIVYGVLQSALSLCASAVLLIAIMAALLAIDAPIAIVSALAFGGSYALLAWIVRRQLRRNSERVSREHVRIVKAIQEGLGGIRDVLLDGTQELYSHIYGQADRSYRAAQARNSFVAQSPRYLMEAFGMVLIAGLAYFLGRRGSGSLASTLPVLAALALGAQRLLPALQQAYSNWVGLNANRVALADTLELLEQPLPAEASAPVPEPLAMERGIELRGVRFRYGGQGPWVLDGIDLRIPAGTRIGFVGSTGSGKSTLMDVIMGLLRPAAGDILVDDRVIAGSDVRAWQRSIAHVPQSIYLADTTIAENIALGVASERIDLARVQAAAAKAQLDGFVATLPDGYDTRVGERGVRLSGGQRQRIGIARALYKQAKVLVFDEATSALDNATEKSVMEAINALGDEYTMLIIAHRLTTVQDCDLIVQLEGGRVVAQGSFDALLAGSERFRRLAHAEKAAA